MAGTRVALCAKRPDGLFISRQLGMHECSGAWQKHGVHTSKLRRFGERVGVPPGFDDGQQFFEHVRQSWSTFSWRKPYVMVFETCFDSREAIKRTPEVV